MLIAMLSKKKNHPRSKDAPLGWIHRNPEFMSTTPHCDFSNGCELYGITIYSYTSNDKIGKSDVLS
ncbi:MAG: hypothetical protein C4K48_04335 [Candidatus Thorarchaeota archaeon]|nr:MAG: hypothetical protein C4K48_04335 [Candidatus Thorarchaeota archaeon]